MTPPECSGIVLAFSLASYGAKARIRAKNSRLVHPREIDPRAAGGTRAHPGAASRAPAPAPGGYHRGPAGTVAQGRAGASGRRGSPRARRAPRNGERRGEVDKNCDMGAPGVFPSPPVPGPPGPSASFLSGRPAGFPVFLKHFPKQVYSF